MGTGPSNQLGRHKRHMWQSAVLSMLHRLHSDGMTPDKIEASALGVVKCADLIIEEMEKRFGDAAMPPSSRQTITLKK